MQEIDYNERSNTDTPVYQTIPKIREEAAGSATTSGELTPSMTCPDSPTHRYFVERPAKDPHNNSFWAPNNLKHRFRQEPNFRQLGFASQ
ncbi:hypothetical protein JTB14_029917 [Gonioctena quinquepunctata]|nr:hypothetical protein JTB14_029917 [Gonioctena quinquepunctata]